MDRPDGVGTSATYNYRHFLQLLAIKIRQREGITLEGIRTELRETTGDALERRVAQALAPALVTGTTDGARHDDAHPAIWRHIIIADGVELHVREDNPASREDAVLAMREALRATLGRADLP